MAFQVYFPKEKRPKKEPKPIVSLSKSSIVLNKLARAKIKADRLELAYDPEKRLIRIRPGTDGSALNLKKTKVHARGFFKHFKIQEKGRFEAHYDEEENALYVQL
ncbi:MAG: hypothetical protein QMC81_03655 [Thermoanaerobacterales bacterium]|nr:hypothetical protein [Bacillota bacterium]MDI6906576.1 hypothetical protein [Thermoanaerobacterales bacterium]